LGVADASAFSACSSVKLEDIVISLENSTVPFKDIYITKAVHREVVVSGKAKPGEKEVTQGIKNRWIKVLEVNEREPYALLLGEGETIALAKERQATLVIMDDRKGHILAKALGITVIGTLGVILLAYKLDKISRLKNELDNLRANGFWFSDRLYKELIKCEFDHK